MKRTIRIERLGKKEEKVLIRKIFYLTIISIVLAVILFTLGIQILGRFADLLEIIFPNRGNQQTIESSLPTPPLIDKLPAATNSARLIVSGFATGASYVDIYSDEQKVGDSEVVNEKFIFDNLELKNGENNISAIAKTASGKISSSSATFKIILDIEKPSLEIETPIVGQSFSGNNRIKVSGKTDSDSQVYANGFLANVDPSGKFEVYVPVLEGETTLEIKAIDEAGNVISETRKITYKK